MAASVCEAMAKRRGLDADAARRLAAQPIDFELRGDRGSRPAEALRVGEIGERLSSMYVGLLTTRSTGRSGEIDVWRGAAKQVG